MEEEDNFFYSLEKSHHDNVFSGINSNYRTNNEPTLDERYNQDSMRLHIYKDFLDECYMVNNCIPLNIHYTNFTVLKAAMGIDHRKKGIYIIKSFQLTKINDNEISKILKYFFNNNTNLNVKTIDKIKNDIQNYHLTNVYGNLKFRLVSFIDENDLKNNTVIYNKLLDGYVTKDIINFDINFHNSYKSIVNKIEISLSSNDNKDFWLQLGDKVFPLISNHTVKNNVIKVFNGNSCINEFTFKNIEEFQIFNNEHEAHNNKESSKNKNTKLINEGRKIDVEFEKITLEKTKIIMDYLKINHEKDKLILDKYKMTLEKEKAYLDYKKALLNYQTEKLKKDMFGINIIKDLIKPENIIKIILKSTTFGKGA